MPQPPRRSSSFRRCILRAVLSLVLPASWIPWAAPAPATAAVRLASTLAAEASTGAASLSIPALDEAVARGELSYAEGARQKLLFLFDRAAMDPAWNRDGQGPARCGTSILAEVGEHLGRLDEAGKSLYDRYVTHAGSAPGSVEATLSYETTHFYLQYANSGTNAVPLTDVAPADGVPDFVEQAGIAMETSWDTEVTALGYTAPPASSASQFNNKYLIQFQAQSSYAFTTVVSGTRTKIVLHNTFQGFPPDDDPDGGVLGAMRVSCAHEFKHAIQRTYTLWSEGGWVELDATWMEDIVYDFVNDYYNYIRSSGSPFTAPWMPLDRDAVNNTGSYEDCNWQHYQTERLGNTHMLNFWVRRQANPGEPVLTTYTQNLLASGLGFADAFGEYAAWNFACGTRAGAGYGYGEAAAYPTTPYRSVHTLLPVPATGDTVAHLASNVRLIANPDGALSGTPVFTFAGNQATSWGVSVLLRDRLGNMTRVPLVVSGGAAAATLTGYDYADLDYAALVVANASTSGAAASYTFSADATAPILFTHERAWDTADRTGPYHLTALVRPGTAVPEPSTVELFYRLDGGPELRLAMAPTGNPDEYAADIPGQATGTHVEYRLRALSTANDVAVCPAPAGSRFGFDVVTVYEPFETAAGWTVGAPGDAATTGVWERAIPVPTVAAPEADTTPPPGQFAFVTQNGVPGGSPGAADVDGGKTTLLSPIYDLSAGGPYAQVTARYRRWYSNAFGNVTDDVWRVDASNDGGATWTNLETLAQGNGGWTLVSADLTALFGAVGPLRFRFVAEDQGAGSVVEAGLDDFEIVALPVPAVDAPGASGLAAFSLGPAVPNPARAGSALAFRLSLPAAGPVRAIVRDVRGRVVRLLPGAGTTLPAGQSTLVWDGRREDGGRAAPGVYFLEVAARPGRLERKIAIVR